MNTMFLMEVRCMEVNTEVDIMGNNRRKIAVIGAGNVGATCAFVLRHFDQDG